MKKVYKCYKCGKWFKEAKVVDHGQFGKEELCPFCEGRVHPARGIKRALVCLWWWLKEVREVAKKKKKKKGKGGGKVSE